MERGCFNKIPKLGRPLFIAGMLMALMMLPSLAGAHLTTLHSFSTYNGIGAGPQGTLLLAGNTLYGTTTSGGNFNQGTVFSMNADGTGYTTLYSFTGGYDGADPQGYLVLSGNTLYGTTTGGGVPDCPGGCGTLFSVNTNGTSFNTIYLFPGTAGEPYGSLTLSGNMLYGTTIDGGDSYAAGTIFSLTTDSYSFNTLYSFTDGFAAYDGGYPQGSLTLIGNVLYGTTSQGGTYGDGTLFSLTTDSYSFNTLYSFSGIGTDGNDPIGDLTPSGNVLYGTTYRGGTHDDGTLFSLTTDSYSFNSLYSFNSPPDGANPAGSLLLIGNVLYGTTTSDGGHSQGTLFSLTTNSYSFNTLYTFTDGTDGANPTASLILVGSLLYGTASAGGAAGEGTIFSLNPHNLVFTPRYSFDGGIGSGGTEPHGSLTLSGNFLYGTASTGGIHGYGTVFSVNTDGTGFNPLYSFTDGTDGAYPVGNLTLSGNKLYGTASQGGDPGCNSGSGCGTIFSMNTDGTGFNALYIFPANGDGNPGSNGAYPIGSLTLSGNVLYGTTSQGGDLDCGTAGCGTIFSLTTNSYSFNTIYRFTDGTDGAYPQASLLLSGNVLYGTTYYGGSGGVYGDGTVFSLTTDSYSFNTLHSFIPIEDGNDGANPMGSLTLSGNVLYGTTYDGGIYDAGNLFSVTTDSHYYTNLYSFMSTHSSSDGAYPEGSLTLSGNLLYGTASGSGDYDDGTLFSLTTDSYSFNTLYTFTGSSDGANPSGSLILVGNSLYGTAPNGGAYGQGDLFSYYNSAIPFSAYVTPGSPTTNPGGTVPLTSLAIGGTPPYYYQWYSDVSCGTPIPGATGSDYTMFPSATTAVSLQVSDSASPNAVTCIGETITVVPLPSAPGGGWGGYGSTTVYPTTSVTTTTTSVATTSTIAPGGTNSPKLIVVSGGNMTSSACTKPGTSLSFYYPSIGASFNLTSTSANCISLTALNLTNSVSSGTPGLKALSVINVSTTPATRPIRARLSYPSTATASGVAPYTLRNGSWLAIANYSLNASDSTLSFILPSDHGITALLESNQVATTSISSTTSIISIAGPPQQKGAPDYVLYTLLAAILVIAIAAAYFALMRRRYSRGSGIPPG